MSAQSNVIPAAVVSADAARSGIEQVYLAKDDGNGKAGEPVASFFTNDIPIYCVVVLSVPKPTTVKMNFVAVSVAGVRSETKVVSTSYITKEGQSRVNFTGTPYDTWSSGKYRVDIFIDGKLVTNLPFDMRPASGVFDGSASYQPKTRPRPPLKTKRNY
ncbi:MAG: hypothetical protein ABJA02_16680 [Acidobacteriota bacterium]